MLTTPRLLMTPTELRSLRRQLGLSQRALAELLGLEGSAVADTVRQWESGRRNPKEPALRLFRAAVRWPFVRRWLEKGAP